MAYLQVIRSVPAHGEEGVIRDIYIQVQFDQELDPATITAINFELYRGTDNQKIGGAIHLTEEDNLVTFRPFVLLHSDTSYTFLIRGNLNQVAPIPTGVLSTGGNFIDGNATLAFTTSALTSHDIAATTPLTAFHSIGNLDEQAVDDPLTPVPTLIDPTISIENMPDYTANIGGEGVPPGYVPILPVYTDPKNESINVLETSKVIIRFPYEINLEHSDLSDIIEIERHDEPYDCYPERVVYENIALNNIDLSGIPTAVNEITVDLSNIGTLLGGNPAVGYVSPTDTSIRWPSGSIINIKLKANKIAFTGIAAYNEEYSFNFLSLATPMYGTPAQLKARMPENVAYRYTDFELYRLIMGASRYVVARYGGNIPPEYCYLVARYVLCIILANMVHDTINEHAGIQERTQFGLKIVYGRRCCDGPYDDCAEEALDMLDSALNRSIFTGVKSGATGQYPGRRRGINDKVYGVTTPNLP